MSFYKLESFIELNIRIEINNKIFIEPIISIRCLTKYVIGIVRAKLQDSVKLGNFVFYIF